MPSTFGIEYWNRAWYPIAPLDYLHSDRPNPVKLLGKRMVLWCSDPVAFRKGGTEGGVVPDLPPTQRISGGVYPVMGS